MEDPADKGDRGSFDETGAGLTQLLGLDTPAAAPQASYRADELVREFGTNRQTLHRYETLGLLRPTSSGGEPAYSNADRTRLRVALLGDLLGISSDDALRVAEHYAIERAG